MQDNTEIDIVTDLTPEEVKRLLREVILGPGERQSQYHQRFIGEIDDKGARFMTIWGKGRVVYELSFGSLDGRTLIRLSNNVYQNRLMASALVRGMIAPMGFVVFIFGFVLYNSWQQLITTTLVSVLIVTLCIFFKVEPLSRKEYLGDPSVRAIMKTVNGHVL